MVRKKHITLLLVFSCLIIATKAQLYPPGTKFHIAGLVSHSNIYPQSYLTTSIDTVTLEQKLYSRVKYPDYNQSDFFLRQETNRLYSYFRDPFSNEKEFLLFDFNTKKGDSLSITIFYTHSLGQGIKLQASSIVSIDSLLYTYYYNELNKLDSLKTFYYSGNVRIANNNDTIIKHFQTSITEKVMNVHTDFKQYFLTVTTQSILSPEDYQRIRCIEYPDGKMIKLKWWYDLVGNSFPCNYKGILGQDEITPKSIINIFPNPASNQLYITNFKGEFTILNTVGKELLTATIQNDFPVNITDIDEGVYFIQFKDQLSSTMRFSIIH